MLAISFSAGMAIPAWMNNNASVIDTGSYYNKFLAEFMGERIWRIGEYLPKIWTNVLRRVFLT